MTILATEFATIERRSGTYTDGVFVVSATATERIEIGLQPAPGRVIQQLPWRARQRGVKVGYADERQPSMRGAGPLGQAPDILIRDNGERYEVHGESDWTPHTAGIPHRVYTLVRVAEDEST